MSREQFEAFMKENGPSAIEALLEDYNSPDGFIFVSTETAWKTWQAATAAAYEDAARVCDAHTVDDVLVGVGISKSCADMIRKRAKEVGE